MELGSTPRKVPSVRFTGVVMILGIAGVMQFLWVFITAIAIIAFGGEVTLAFNIYHEGWIELGALFVVALILSPSAFTG